MVLLFCAQYNSLLAWCCKLVIIVYFHCESIILKLQDLPSYSPICNTSQVSRTQHSLVAKAIRVRHRFVLNINLLQEVVYYMTRIHVYNVSQCIILL